MADVTTYAIMNRINQLKKNAAARSNLDENSVHVGHLALQGMLDDPEGICQIDAATGQSETNKSVAKRACRLASAMANYGLKPGDAVILMGPNHMDLCIPFFACHFGGFPMCAVDPSNGPNELIHLFPYIQPKIVFCQKSCEEKVKNAFKVNRLLGNIVIFDDQEADIAAFIKEYNGTQVYFRPAELDQTKTSAWLTLTSGTTGLPKVAVIPFDVLLNAIIQWWLPFPLKMDSCVALATLQWVSSLLYFLSAPIKGFTRVQSSEPLTGPRLVGLINKYRPNTTTWSPYLLGQFLPGAEDFCDLTCFIYILIGGSAIEKPLLDRLRKKCPAFLCLVYGMTELLAPIFDYDEKTPFGSTGKRQSKYEFKLMDDTDQPLEGPNETGELWVKGFGFFTGYLNNPEETRTILTEDGWFKTGDIFYKDEQDYYYFVERKRLLIKHFRFKISPLQMEDIIKRHPAVADACVVSLPDVRCLELPIAAVLKKNGSNVAAQEIYDILRKNMEVKQLIVAVFFVDSLPVTSSGKVHRAKVKEIAGGAQKTVFGEEAT